MPKFRIIELYTEKFGALQNQTCTQRISPKDTQSLPNTSEYRCILLSHVTRSQQPDIAQRSQTSANNSDAITDLFIMIYVAGKTYKFIFDSGAGPSGVTTIEC